MRTIGPPPKVKGELPEPSDVAFFDNGDYAALWNCQIGDFCMAIKVNELDELLVATLGATKMS